MVAGCGVSVLAVPAVVAAGLVAGIGGGATAAAGVAKATLRVCQVVSSARVWAIAGVGLGSWPVSIAAAVAVKPQPRRSTLDTWLLRWFPSRQT